MDSGCVYLCALSGVCGLDAVETAGGGLRLWGWRRVSKPFSASTFNRWAINNQLRTGADKGTPTV